MIKFDKVSKTYKQTIRALDDVTLEITKGEFVFLVGASGSGKSTFIKLLLKDVAPDSGEIVVAGKQLNGMRPWRVPAFRRELGCVFQDFKLLESKTVFENVAFAQEVTGKVPGQIRVDVPDALEVVGLSHKHEAMPHELSGGEQQRVSIARAIVNRPRIMLCDEPTGNLDPETSVGIMKLLDQINRAGTTILMATHDSHIVDSMRKRVVELQDGHMVRDQVRGTYGYAG
ncbi:cell division ATP-binding protein FtsE [Euzebya tangerina]|uniref:cell division ATP-binding protein FtsE n=1 Tax=Euzebya tangerina TaxID=591198 RepID=UPI000E3243C1|nr:cell division ATP-binding protein FtsE [Euzebya tangerina]